ncbi:MAG TPA: AAA-like domain-containing protein [Roseimicrobium sp.]|nr:AAA-like domain-containing protein [Roseimicrobium sp.]
MSGPLRVALVHQRDSQVDEQVAKLLESQLSQNGCSVFVDRQREPGVAWAREVERQIRTADVVVPLLSEDSIQSEMFAFGIEHAHDAARERQGRPQLLPVRVRYTGPLPELIAGFLDPLQYQLWEGEHDNEGLVTELLYSLKNLPGASVMMQNPPPKGQRFTPAPPAPISHKPVATAALEMVGGAVPLDSEFYLIRPVDTELQAAIERRDSTILLKGARQMGKTSLLARGLAFARSRGAGAAFTDFQKLNVASLANVNNFYFTLAESLADQLNLLVLPADVWDDRRGANANFERYIRREVLPRLEKPLVWGLDEVDRLFGCTFGSEVFGLFRSWHNERALDPDGPWSNLTLIIAYATEAHLFISDMNQSPFNVGTRLSLEDFTPLQVAELNRRYGTPLKGHDELNRFVRLLGGHPYLLRRGLHELATHKTSFESFESLADRDEGIFGDHLRRILVLLARDEELTGIVKGILHGSPCPTPESFYRLRSAGLVNGTSQSDVRPRCRLYAIYLKRHLG